MSLLKRINKILKDDEITSYYSISVIDDFKSIMVKINKFKEVMSTLNNTRRKNQSNERKELVEHLLRLLKYIEMGLDTYTYDLVDLCVYVKNNHDMRPTSKTSAQLEYALNTKVELTKEFETLYTNFKNMAKKLDNIPLNEMLTKMRNIFDFSKKFSHSTGV